MLIFVLGNFTEKSCVLPLRIWDRVAFRNLLLETTPALLAAVHILVSKSYRATTQAYLSILHLEERGNRDLEWKDSYDLFSPSNYQNVRLPAELVLCQDVRINVVKAVAVERNWNHYFKTSIMQRQIRVTLALGVYSEEDVLEISILMKTASSYQPSTKRLRRAKIKGRHKQEH